MDNNTTPQPSANQTTDPKAVSKKDKMLVFTIILVLLVLSGLAIAGFLFIKEGPDTVQGQCEATEVRISGKLPGRVVMLYVKEGDRVKAGDTLVHIHSTVADARLYQAQSMENVAKAAEDKVDEGTRTQIIQSAYDIYKQAQAATSIAQKTYQRLENLCNEGVVSEQKRDEAKAAFEAATAGEAAAKSQWELAKAGPQKSDRSAARAMVNAAKGSVKEVNALLEDQYLVAPCDGEITAVYPQESELVALGAPIMSLQKDDHFAIFNVRETLLKNIKEGSKIKVYIPALDITTDMEVFYIRDLGTYANWQATKSTGDYDARTFEIKARATKKINNFRPGMSVVLVQ